MMLANEMGEACDGFYFLLLFLSNLSGSASEILCANCWEVKVSRKKSLEALCAQEKDKSTGTSLGFFPAQTLVSRFVTFYPGVC